MSSPHRSPRRRGGAQKSSPSQREVERLAVMTLFHAMEHLYDSRRPVSAQPEEAALHVLAGALGQVEVDQ